MKALRIFLLILIIIGVIAICTERIWVPKLVSRILLSEGAYAPATSLENQSGTYCFFRSQKATASEPYSVEENILLKINGNSVTGTKDGIQNGPNMTNGFEGTLSGVKKENLLELVYSYVIEGSNNKELEIYEIRGASLIKMRWPLKEEGDMLVPDKTGERKTILYSAQNCQP